MKLLFNRPLLWIIIGGVLIIWLVLTLIAQQEGKPKVQEIGREYSGRSALIIYNPDLFYNLDEQVCTAFANGLSEKGWKATVATVAAAKELSAQPFDLYVFCANTYNWAPDRAVSNLIKNSVGLEGKNVVAITLGSGSTARAKRNLENLISAQKANLLSSKEYWLMRPNDEAKSDRSNVETATEKAFGHGMEIAYGLQK